MYEFLKELPWQPVPRHGHKVMAEGWLVLGPGPVLLRALFLKYTKGHF